MKAMQPVPTPTTDLTTLDDDTIEALFAEAGIFVSVVGQCTVTTCAICRASARPSRAA